MSGFLETVMATRRDRVLAEYGEITPPGEDAKFGRIALALRFAESGLLVRGRELLCRLFPHLGRDRAPTDRCG